MPPERAAHRRAGPSERVVQRHEGRGELVGRGVDRPPDALLLDVPAQLGLEVGAYGSASSSTPCTSEPNAAPDGRSAIGERDRAGVVASESGRTTSTSSASSSATSSSRAESSGSEVTPPVSSAARTRPE